MNVTSVLILLSVFLFLVIVALVAVVIVQAIKGPHSTAKTEIAAINGKLDVMQGQFASNLQAVTSQLGVFGEVKQSLGAVQEAVRRTLELGEDIHQLQTILSSPNKRGGFGEILLENLLASLLPPKYYKLQYKFADNSRCDAAILLANKVLPVDAKFPLQDYQPAAGLESGEQPRQSGVFARAVKARVDETAHYIRPDEQCFNFAMMYVPAESIYAEIVSSAELFNYAMRRRVVVTSPASFFAYLNCIVFGLRGMQIEDDARNILNRLSALNLSLGEVESAYTTLGTHLSNAQSKYHDTGKRLDRFKVQLESVVQEGLPVNANPPGLPNASDISAQVESHDQNK